MEIENQDIYTIEFDFDTQDIRAYPVYSDIHKINIPENLTSFCIQKIDGNGLCNNQFRLITKDEYNIKLNKYILSNKKERCIERFENQYKVGSYHVTETTTLLSNKLCIFSLLEFVKI